MRSVLILLLVAACMPTPKERYLQAVNKKMNGNAQGYYEDLLALAHDAPDSRAGRRARATLASNPGLTDAYVAGVLAAAVVPALRSMQERGAQSEAETSLRDQPEHVGQ